MQLIVRKKIRPVEGQLGLSGFLYGYGICRDCGKGCQAVDKKVSPKAEHTIKVCCWCGSGYARKVLGEICEICSRRGPLSEKAQERVDRKEFRKVW